MVSTENESSRSPVTSLDLLMELQGEQQSFRFLVRALSALLATAAVIAVGSVIYFYFELQGLRAEYARQAQLNEVNLRIVAGEASRRHRVVRRCSTRSDGVGNRLCEKEEVHERPPFGRIAYN